MLTLALLLATPIETQRAFETCLEVEADRAARAGVEEAAFDLALTNLCVREEVALVAAVAAQRATRDPALTGRQRGDAVPGGRAADAATGFASGLRGVVAAGYPTLLQLRGPRPDPNRYPYGGARAGAAGEPVPPPLSGGAVPPLGPRGKRVTIAEPVPPPLGGGSVPPLGTQGKRVTLAGPAAAAVPGPKRITVPGSPITTRPSTVEPASRSTPAPAPLNPSPQPKRIRVPQG